MGRKRQLPVTIKRSWRNKPRNKTLYSPVDGVVYTNKKKNKTKLRNMKVTPPRLVRSSLIRDMHKRKLRVNRNSKLKKKVFFVLNISLRAKESKPWWLKNHRPPHPWLFTKVSLWVDGFYLVYIFILWSWSQNLIKGQKTLFETLLRRVEMLFTKSYLVDYHKRSDRVQKDVSIILGNFQALSYYSPTEVNDSYYTDNAGTVWSSRKRPLRMLHNTIISLFTTWTNKNRFPLIDKLCNYVSCKYHSFAKPKEL